MIIISASVDSLTHSTLWLLSDIGGWQRKGDRGHSIGQKIHYYIFLFVYAFIPLWFVVYKLSLAALENPAVDIYDTVDDWIPLQVISHMPRLIAVEISYTQNCRSGCKYILFLDSSGNPRCTASKIRIWKRNSDRPSICRIDNINEDTLLPAWIDPSQGRGQGTRTSLWLILSGAMDLTRLVTEDTGDHLSILIPAKQMAGSGNLWLW